MKKAISVIMLSGLWLSVNAQSHGGMQQYVSRSDDKTFLVVPVLYYQASNNWYAEGRYNYEAAETVSFYAGRTFSHEGVVSYTVSPIAGFVAGRFNGGSAGANIDAVYKRFSLSSQLQYTFSISDKTADYTYSWTDADYQVFPGLAAGISIQQSKLYHAAASLEGGFLIEAQFKNWSLPLYIFNPASQQRYFVLGLGCEWEYKKRK